MPSSTSDASSTSQPAQEMTVAIQDAADDRRPAREPAICPTDDDSLTPLRERPRREINRQSWEYVVRSGLAGGLAGCAAKTVVGPLDRVKILFQASNPQFAKYTGSWFGVVTAMRDIYSADGSRGLFRGHSATLLRIFPYAGIKFLAYEQIRAVVIKDRSQETPLRRFFSGSLAGTVSVFFTYPLEVIRVRLAFETKHDSRSSLSSICKQIYNERPPAVNPGSTHIDVSSLSRVAATTITATTATIQHATPSSGFANFFRGFTPTLWGMLPYAGSSFLTHDTAGDLMRHPRLAPYTTLPRSSTSTKPSNPDKPAQLKYWAELATGGFAGFVSQTVSYPLEVIRRRMQVGAVVGDGHRLGMIEVAKRIYGERGAKGFFVGLGIGYVKVVPMVAVSFFVYERGKVWLGI
ncbi:coenzyme A transporter [Cryomyces antarcticus]|uniref:Mitochondrial thiamine pyrophosphate carrier 1 n=1 Tax=Cryomyces antarcticus TaxID=329879 RepID=A0ABR0LPU1_9PEZI|nr:coenzyme A transporter [Cryomyces antarcticus]KAK5018950.1 coenzyme A transporter [Cryomyces antarcticus]KAK5201613.1 coenzyme A transporter [Cryomyces antarcticus]